MATLHQWLDKYGTYHQNPTNKVIHEIFVPLIVFSVLGLLWSIPLPHEFRNVIHYHHVGLINIAAFIFILSLIYYIILSIPIAIGMALMTVVMLAILTYLQAFDYPILIISISIFIISWIAQFIGHKIEGKKPAFLTDLQFLLIGPAWILAALYRKLHIPY